MQKDDLDRKRPPDPYWTFELDEQLLDALETTNLHLENAIQYPLSWKWAIIALHAAVHCAFAVVLRHSDGAQILTEKLEKRTYERWETERQTGELSTDWGPERVDDFLNLFAKVQDSERMSYLNGRPLVPSEPQSESVRFLNYLRGTLSHPSATSHSVHSLSVLVSMRDCLAIIDFLLNQAQPHPLVHTESADLANTLLERLNVQIDGLIDQHR